MATALAVGLAVSGCGHYPYAPGKRAYRNEGGHAIPNGEDLDRYRAERAQFSRNGTAPNLCLAFSGGGMRSAAFSYGVLQALQRAQVGTNGGQNRSMLENVDVISSVSGGSYLASWYYASHFHHTYPPEGAANRQVSSEAIPTRLSNDELLGIGSASTFAERAQQADAVKHAIEGKGRLVRVRDTVENLVEHILFGIPANALANIFFGFHANTSTAHYFYYNRLKNNLHAGEDIPMHQLGSFFAATQKTQTPLPFFIINATADNSYYELPRAAPASDVIYEFTPRDYGSVALRKGEYKQAPDLGLARAVAISGAAVDGENQHRQGFRRTLRSLYEPSIGYNLDNPDAAQASFQWVGALPLGLYALPGAPWSDAWWSGANGFRIHLSDGGHSENLGIFALVRRGCDHIVAVDAGHDPDYMFDDYRRLRCILRLDMKSEIKLNGIDDYLQKKYVNALPDTNSCKIELAREDDLKLNLAAGAIPPFPVFAKEQYPDGAPYVFTGTIAYCNENAPVGTINWPPPGCYNKKETKITYIKLPMVDDFAPPKDEKEDVDVLTTRLNRQYGPNVARYIIENRKQCTVKFAGMRALIDRDCHFPHRNTMDQDFPSEQFAAYRDLGCMTLGRHLVEKADPKDLGVMVADYRRERENGPYCRLDPPAAPVKETPLQAAAADEVIASQTAR